jgi:hypothetical protein
MVNPPWGLKHLILYHGGMQGRLLSSFRIPGNAFSYGAADQPVRVRACSGAGYFELSVTNAGAPIPAAALEHLPHLFYRSVVNQNREAWSWGFISRTRPPRPMAGRSK